MPNSQPYLNRSLKRLFSILFIAIIRFYQSALSPFLGARCRFTPTCSAYGLEAIQKHGPFKGGWLTIRRFLSCHPWGRHGYDPVP